MPLHTKIITPTGQEVEPTIEIEEPTATGMNHVVIKHGDFALGHMFYRILKDSIYIEKRENKSKYKGIGSALGEYAFRESIKQGKGGHITNTAAWTSHVFHFKWGLRPTQDIVWNWGVMNSDLKELYHNYLTTSSEQEKIGYKNRIMQDARYKDLKQFAVGKLKEKNQLPVTEIEFEDVIKHSTTFSITEKIEEAIQEEKETGERQDTSFLTAVQMHLPDETIQKKIKEYGIDVAEEIRKHQEEVIKQTEIKKQREEAIKLAEAEKQREEAIKLVEIEKQREEAIKLAEIEKQREEAIKLAEIEKLREEAIKLAEIEKQREEAIKKAEAEKQREEAIKQAEIKRQLEEAIKQAQDTRNQTIKNLYSAIEGMKTYGDTLVNEMGASTKGKIASSLANDLKILAEDFFNPNKKPDLTPQEFNLKFSQLLMSKNSEMSEYRMNWETIVKNIAIALTGIGLLAIAGKLIYSKINNGRALLFFSQKRTTREEKIIIIRESFNKVSSI